MAGVCYNTAVNLFIINFKNKDMFKKIFLASFICAFTLSLATVALAQSGQGLGKQNAPGQVKKSGIQASLAASKATFDPVCMQTAVDKRETALMAAFDTRYNSTKTVLQKRADAQKAAWAITDAKARRTAMKKVWADYAVSIKKVVKEWQANRANAWKTFTTDRKACGAQAATEDGNTGASVDSQL